MNGEGFAYFRWHSMRWPEIYGCMYSENFMCRREWAEMRTGADT